MEIDYIEGFGDRSDRSAISVTRFGHQTARGFLENYPDSRERLERVSELIFGFETPYGMEMLATLHWIATRENEQGSIDFPTALEKVRLWSDRKRDLFQEKHLRKAWERLEREGWLTIVPF